MLVRVLRELSAFNNIVVIFENKNHFENELVCDKLICLNTTSLLSVFSAAKKIKAILRQYQPDLVHSHLPLCNFAARLGVPSHTPLLTTIHTSVATANDYKKWHIRFLDKFTYSLRKSTIIAVSRGALNDYFSFLGKSPKNAQVLYTFVDTGRFNKQAQMHERDKFLMVTVGALRKGKNLSFLLQALQQVQHKNIELHIYGIGPEEDTLSAEISQLAVPAILKGQVSNLEEVLPGYDLYVMPSLFEGFSLSVLEAMAVGLPLLLSDIPSFREQCADTAVFFSPADAADCAGKLGDLAADKDRRAALAKAARERLLENFTLQHHMQKLLKIYQDALEDA